jgi:hypothetical protein
MHTDKFFVFDPCASVLLTFRFFASCKDFLLTVAESASNSRTGYPAQTTVFLTSLATLREMVFGRTAWIPPKPKKS